MCAPWCGSVVVWCVMWCGVLARGGGQYWDQEGLTLPEPPLPPPGPSLGARLLASLTSRPYFESPQPAEDHKRWKRMSPELHQTSISTDTDKVGGHSAVGGKMAVVGKCCPVGQNLSRVVEDKEAVCAPSTLPFQPLFYDYNDTGITDYDINEWETIVGNPCQYGRYLLEPEKQGSADEFYLLRNGSLVVPAHKRFMLHTKDFCMETFWSPEGLHALTLPVVCFPQPSLAPSTQQPWVTFIAILMLVSVPFLLVTSITHGCVSAVWKATGRRHGRALAAHCACLALAFLALATTQLAAPDMPQDICVIAAFTIQFSFLACFFWLNLLCIDTYLNITKKLTPEEAKRSMLCCDSGWWSGWGVWWVWGWGMPSFITLATLIMDRAPGLPFSLYKPNIGTLGCWFQSDTSTLVFFYGPVSLLLLANLTLFILSGRSLSRQSATLDPFSASGTGLDSIRMPADDPYTPNTQSNSIRQKWIKYKKVFKLCSLLFLVMGLNWILEVVSWLVGGSSPFFYVSDLFNALQGITISAIFMRPPILNLLWGKLSKKVWWLPWRRSSQDLEGGSSGGTSSPGVTPASV